VAIARSPDSSEWTYVLSASERAEIIGAVGYATNLGRTRHTRSRRLPLPALTDRIHEWTASLHRGRGFVFVAAFPSMSSSPTTSSSRMSG